MDVDSHEEILAVSGVLAPRRGLGSRTSAHAVGLLKRERMRVVVKKTSGHIEIFDVRGDDAVITGHGYDYATDREARTVWDRWKTAWGVAEGAGQFRVTLYREAAPLDTFEVTENGFRAIIGTNPDTPSVYAVANAAFWTAHVPSMTILRRGRTTRS